MWFRLALLSLVVVSGLTVACDGPTAFERLDNTEDRYCLEVLGMSTPGGSPQEGETTLYSPSGSSIDVPTACISTWKEIGPYEERK